MIKKIKSILSQPESLTLEFKESKGKLNRDVDDIVCAFANREGGYIILDVNDSGNIVGVNENKIEHLKSYLITSVNNPQKLNINDSAVKKHLNSLKDKGILKRVGGTRGYWEVVE